jgi:type I restriction enzyme S subunit
MANIANLITEHMDIWAAAESEKKSGRGRASGNVGSVYGVKKLRELILELAVRGKLVPQDPNDEPASELLKRTELENRKPNLLITEEEKSYELPKNWEYARLGNLFNIVYGKGLSNSELTEDGYEVFGANGIIGKYTKYLYEEPQLLVSCRGAYSGKPNISPPKCFVTSNSLVLGSSWKNIDLKYFYYSLSIANKEKIVTGSAQPQVTTTNLEPFVVGLPPLAEQHRIVAKVDELMALCDQLEQQHNNAQEAHEALALQLLATLTLSQNAIEFNTNWQRIYACFDVLFTTESSIDTLKQTLLQLAVMGKLVLQNPNDEPASELLKRIQAEKFKLIAEGKLKKEKQLVPIGEGEKLFKLPRGWQWVRFNMVANTRLGKMLDQAKNKGAYRPYLRNTNVQWFAFELDDLKEMRFEEHELDEYRVITGDLVICEGGEPGRCAIWESQHGDMFIQKALHRARPWTGISPYFLQLCFRVDASNGHLDQFFTGATIKHFSGEKLAIYSIPLPPSAEQHRIVAKVDAITALCDQLKTRIQQANQQQQAIADALVEQAVT